MGDGVQRDGGRSHQPVGIPVEEGSREQDAEHGEAARRRGAVRDDAGKEGGGEDHRGLQDGV